MKPEFWGDEKLSPLPPIDRLVFLGLISMADDAGRVTGSLKAIDGFIFPETDDTAGPSLEVLATSGRIQRGVTASGQRIIQIVHWKHQKIDKPNLSAALPPIVKPAPDNTVAKAPRPVGETSPKNPGGVVEASTPHINDLRSGSVSTINDHVAEGDASATFEEAWRLYPKRPNNSRPAALRAWLARVKAGESEDVMLTGTRSYAAYCERRHQDPEFVKLAATFYGPDKHYSSDYGTPSDDDVTPEIVYVDQKRQREGAAHGSH